MKSLKMIETFILLLSIIDLCNLVSLCDGGSLFEKILERYVLSAEEGR
jgi:hypothetical protein